MASPACAERGFGHFITTGMATGTRKWGEEERKEEKKADEQASQLQEGRVGRIPYFRKASPVLRPHQGEKKLMSRWRNCRAQTLAAAKSCEW